MRRNILRQQLLQELVKTGVVQRLKNIDLSSVPQWLCPWVSPASRYQHSLGVGELSLLVRDGPLYDQLLLTATSVLHDVGNGPFPHISDPIMKQLLGFSHEGAVRFAFDYSPIKESKIIENYGLTLQEISSLLEGQHRLSYLLQGFPPRDLPDLDNADNIHRFITTLPNKDLQQSSYHPVEIATSFSLEMKEKTVSEDLQKRWLRDREWIYQCLWNDTLNMVGWTMLGRALRLLLEQLNPTFFRMTNKEAFQQIKLKLPKLAHALQRKKYKILFDRRYSLLKGDAQKLADLTTLRNIEDEICKATNLEGWELGLTVDKPPIRRNSNYWRVYLVTYQGKEEPQILLKEMLANSNPVT